MATPKQTRRMTDAEFTALVARIGYVEACVASVKCDGHPYDEAKTRSEAQAALVALGARGLAFR